MSKRFALLGALVIGVVAFVAYQPALKIQFYDGWWYLIWAATMDLPRYAIQFLDPANITQGYRPVQGLYMLVQYRLFGFNPDGYHIAHTLLHAANAILLFLLVARLGARWQTALIAALLYAASPVISLAVFWHAVVDPLSAFFYLLTILLWRRFLETARAADWVIAFVAYLFALFSKEVAVFLPLILFLVERWFFVPTQPTVIASVVCGAIPNSQTEIASRRSLLRNLAAAQTSEVSETSEVWLPVSARTHTAARYGILAMTSGLPLLVKRYAPFVIALVPYLILVYSVQSHGEFSSQFGFKIGPHMLSNLTPYLAVLAFPWTTELPNDAAYYVWLGFAAVLYVGVVLYKRSAALFFLGLVAVLNISPLTGFPLDYFNTRYLYLSITASTIVIALLFEIAARALSKPRAYVWIASAVVALIVFASGARVGAAALDLAEYTRQTRVPFRDIAQQHPTFPDDTYLYFVYSPRTPPWDFEGMFLARYGSRVKVDGTETGRPAELHRHNAAFVYYFDPTGRPIELPVEKSITTRITPALPARYAIPISLEDYQTASSTLSRGKALVVILHWRATGRIDQDYAVFARLVDARGKILAEFEGQPRRGAAPTSAWEPGRLSVDAIVLPIAPDAPLGENYRLEVGMYDTATARRLSIVNASNQPICDAFVIEPFSIAP